MRIKSLGHLSDLIFTEFDGKVEDRGDYVVVRTLSNPNYFWGNLLIFNRPPQATDFESWTTLFKAEFTDPAIYHVTLAWDSPGQDSMDVSCFLQNGYELEKKIVLAAAVVNEPPRPNSDLNVRPLQNDQEWERMIEIQVESAHDHLPRDEWELFYRSQSSRYRKMVNAHRGQWFGGFLGDELVAGMGLFHHGGIGRYQMVVTHPSYLRRGICGTMVYRVGRWAFDELHLKQLIMCADPEYHAARIYESVGFRPVQTDYGVCWWDKERKI